jgi:hypothetical protein
MENVRDVNARFPMAQTLRKNTDPVAAMCPDAAPGDMKEG